MLGRKTTGSVVCPSCGSLVGVRDDKCYTCGRVNPGLWGFAPVLRQLGRDFGFAPLVIGGSSIVYVLTLLASGPGLTIVSGNLLEFLSPSTRSLLRFGMSGAVPVFGYGMWWTLLSATWLHGNLLHIVFNMYWVRRFGADSVELIGPARTVIVYTISGISGFLLSSIAGWVFPPLPIIHGAGFTIGASGAVLGLLGAMAHYGRVGGSRLIRSEVGQYALWFIVMGFIMPGTDNFAHIGGFLGGYATSAVFNPLTRERGDHILIAVGCLAASFLAIVYSVFRTLSIFG